MTYSPRQFRLESPLEGTWGDWLWGETQQPGTVGSFVNPDDLVGSGRPGTRAWAFPTSPGQCSLLCITFPSKELLKPNFLMFCFGSSDTCSLKQGVFQQLNKRVWKGAGYTLWLVIHYCVTITSAFSGWKHFVGREWPPSFRCLWLRVSPESAVRVSAGAAVPSQAPTGGGMGIHLQAHMTGGKTVLTARTSPKQAGPTRAAGFPRARHGE